MYVSDAAAASRIMLSLLFEMLGSTQTYTRVHSFNLLLNLSVHMNLLEEVSSLEDSGNCFEQLFVHFLTFPSFKGSSNIGSFKRIQVIQEVPIFVSDFYFSVCVNSLSSAGPLLCFERNVTLDFPQRSKGRKGN